MKTKKGSQAEKNGVVYEPNIEILKRNAQQSAQKLSGFPRYYRVYQTSQSPEATTQSRIRTSCRVKISQIEKKFKW